MSTKNVTIKLSKREMMLLAMIVIYTENPGVISLLSKNSDSDFTEEAEAISRKISSAWKRLALSNEDQAYFKQLLTQIEVIGEQDGDPIEI